MTSVANSNGFDRLPTTFVIAAALSSLNGYASAQTNSGGQNVWAQPDKYLVELSSSDLREMNWHQNYSSTQSFFSISDDLPQHSAASFNITPLNTSKLTRRLKQKSGLTWLEIASIFNVEERSLYEWRNGSNLNARNEEALRSVFGVIEFVDTGRVELNRQILRNVGEDGKSALQLLRENDYDGVRKRLGEGQGQGRGSKPESEALSSHAESFNTPTGWNNY